ncbi:unnamed protein product [Arctogadus glacialis]
MKGSKEASKEVSLERPWDWGGCLGSAAAKGAGGVRWVAHPGLPRGPLALDSQPPQTRAERFGEETSTWAKREQHQKRDARTKRKEGWSDRAPPTGRRAGEKGRGTPTANVGAGEGGMGTDC